MKGNMEILEITGLVMFKKSPASNFDEVCFFVFLLLLMLYELYQMTLLNPRSLKSTVFSSKKIISFRLLFTFRSLIRFELMFFIWLMFFTWCERRVSFDSISSVEWSWHLCQNQLTRDIQNGFIFGLSVVFHWSVYQFLCQYYTVLITLNFEELTAFRPKKLWDKIEKHV